MIPREILNHIVALALVLSRKVGLTGIAAVVLVAGLAVCNRGERAKQLFGSCQNHRGLLNMDLRTSEVALGGVRSPPFQPEVPGYEMLATFAGRTSGALNCHHGAPGMRVGGWQAVNLPADKWTELHRLWTSRYGGDLPFYWCGKPNSLHKRVVCTLMLNPNGDSFVEHHVLRETESQEQVKRLNNCLSELGLSPVALDVPDAVAWASFDTHGRGP